MAHSHLGMLTDGIYIYDVFQYRGPTSHNLVLDTQMNQCVYWAIDVSDAGDLENELSSKQVSFVDVMSLMVATDWANQLFMADLAIAGQLDKAASSLLNRRIPL
ncbi:hypothetical protein AgCh_028402 [Apium graveolens]